MSENGKAGSGGSKSKKKLQILRPYSSNGTGGNGGSGGGGPLDSQFKDTVNDVNLLKIQLTVTLEENSQLKSRYVCVL